ncbi:MAG: CinA family protein [Gammaproteobacteria bacterium]|nr:CinA family protein [Gammaproteobacteria bacterium]
MTPPTDADIHALAARVAERLLGQGRRLVVAESCTGGWVAKACTDLAGSSRWFLGGAVAYANEVKIGVVGVRSDTLGRDGAVSQGVVREMATGALERFGGEVGLAVSGIAGPDGGSPGKPVGTVWFAWSVRHDDRFEVRTSFEQFAGDREAVRRQAVAAALRGVLEV